MICNWETRNRQEYFAEITIRMILNDDETSPNWKEFVAKSRVISCTQKFIDILLDEFFCFSKATQLNLQKKKLKMKSRYLEWRYE